MSPKWHVNQCKRKRKKKLWPTKSWKDSKQAPIQAPIYPTLLKQCHDTTIHYFFDNFPPGIFILSFLSALLPAFWVRDSQRLALMAVRVKLAWLSPTKAARPRW